MSENSREWRATKSGMEIEVFTLHDSKFPEMEQLGRVMATLDVEEVEEQHRHYR